MVALQSELLIRTKTILDFLGPIKLVIFSPRIAVKNHFYVYDAQTQPLKIEKAIRVLIIEGTLLQMYGMVSISATVAKSCLLFMAQKNTWQT